MVAKEHFSLSLFLTLITPMILSYQEKKPGFADNGRSDCSVFLISISPLSIRSYPCQTLR